MRKGKFLDKVKTLPQNPLLLTIRTDTSSYSSNSLKSIPSTALSVSLALEAIYLLFFFKLKRVLVVTLLLIFSTAGAPVVIAV